MAYDDGSEAKVRKCPYCGHTQYIDPAESLRPFVCANTTCRQESSYAAWCNPSSSPHCLAINTETSIAFTEDILCSTIAYTTSEDGGGVASGTVIAAAGRILVATAAHALSDDNATIGLVAKNRPINGDRSRWVVRQVKHPNKDIDVGIIELSPAAVDEIRFAPLSAPIPQRSSDDHVWTIKELIERAAQMPGGWLCLSCPQSARF